MSTKLMLLLACLAGFSACSPEQSNDRETVDILILNGTVYDGSLEPPKQTNIAVMGDRIVSMDASSELNAKLVIDATDLVVTPGFIDPHTHVLDDLLDDELKQNISHITQGVTTVFVGNDGGGIPDRETGVATMRRQGIGPNVGFFAGHNNIRTTVLGLEDRPPTNEELLTMQNLVTEEMRAGALGLSTGLFYKPGSYSNTEEVIELAKSIVPFGGIYDTHLRDESSYNIGLLGSIEEVLNIAESTGVRVHIAHLKALGRDVWGQSGDVIARIDAARGAGVQITADQYPYQASGTSFGSALVPRWVMADSQEAMFARFSNPDLDDRIQTEMEGNIYRRGGPDTLLVTGESEWRGKTLEEISQEMETAPYAAAIEVVRSGNPSIASFNMTLDDISAIGIQSWVMTSSDGGTGHPRKFATYPKAYRDFVVDQSLLTVTQFVHRSSGLVADTFSLCDRGYLEPGRKADIAVIDLDEFSPQADFQNPERLATGVEHLLVNGVPTIQGQAANDSLAGAVIDRQNLACPD